MIDLIYRYIYLFKEFKKFKEFADAINAGLKGFVSLKSGRNIPLERKENSLKRKENPFRAEEKSQSGRKIPSAFTKCGKKIPPAIS